MGWAIWLLFYLQQMRQFLDLKSFIGTPKVKQGEHEEAHKALSRGEEEGGGLSSMDNKHG